MAFEPKEPVRALPVVDYGRPLGWQAAMLQAVAVSGQVVVGR